MSLKSVSLESDVYLVCLTHALSTEHEEVMGLLIGEVDEEKVLHISHMFFCTRSDKRPDRVEISPEQQSDAAIKAEELGIEQKRPLRVVGWYHSHPHITVWPSHVDLRTQKNYQDYLDSRFVGLIYSVFSDDKATKQQTIQVTCFQTREINSQFERSEVPLCISPAPQVGPQCLASLTELPQILMQEEDEAYTRVCVDGQDLLTRLHNSSVYSKSLCHVVEVVSGPLLHSLEQRLHHNKQRTSHLQDEKESLTKRILAVQTRLRERQEGHLSKAGGILVGHS